MDVRTNSLGLLALALGLACGCSGDTEPGGGAPAPVQDATTPPAGMMSMPVAGMDPQPSTAPPTDAMDATTAGAAAPAPLDGMPAADAGPSWLAIYDDVFVRAGCNGPGLCHGGTAGMFQMLDPASTYAALVNAPAAGMTPGMTGMACQDAGLVRVVPGAPEESLLMMKLDGTHGCGDAMPPVGGLLTEEERELVRDWIMQGAQDN